ncbi:hypothetical protein [Algoriphagus chordae]|uniref:Uncharacterized protein n=1 Tax=Algoriphagus chordae TaxID=237019 RepID=A0A2W7QZ39_9BACT|nr:hypothetical protein [Algoriphagus chordae]PZX48947.1 hypothetical protein LV85_03437 [Algoriphagus chordae]
MGLRLILLWVFICASQFACCQSNVIVLKKCFSEPLEGFPSKNHTCQKLSFVGQTLDYKINYSFNGWQIIDSVAYQNDKGKLCAKFFQPVYDVENRIVKSYELLNVDCNQVTVFLNEIKDKYGLSRDYLANLNFLLSKNPEKTEKGYQFNGGIIPSLFTKYGIPYDKLLKAFSFNIEDNMIKADSFMYDTLTLSRKYEYESGQLKEVKISIKDRDENILSQFREVFELK